MKETHRSNAVNGVKEGRREEEGVELSTVEGEWRSLRESQQPNQTMEKQEPLLTNEGNLSRSSASLFSVFLLFCFLLSAGPICSFSV
jgi:hypothetical protein